MKHDFEWVSTHANWCPITIKSYSTGWTDYSLASCFPTCWRATGVLGYFETSSVCRDCHSIIDTLWCRARL